MRTPFREVSNFLTRITSDARLLFPDMDIYNIIIDLCGAEDFLRDRYSTLCSCATTCRSFYRRSMDNLYSRVRFRKPEKLELFVRTLEEQGTYGKPVRDLHITPDSPHKHGAFDFAHPTIVKYCTHVTSLRIGEFKWGAQPARYWEKLVAFHSVTSLEISNTIFPSSSDFVALVKSISKLSHLSCGMITFEPSIQESRNFAAITLPSCKVPLVREVAVCSELRSVILWVSAHMQLTRTASDGEFRAWTTPLQSSSILVAL